MPSCINESKEFLESGARVETGQELFSQDRTPVTQGMGDTTRINTQK